MKNDLLHVMAKAMDNAREGITISDALLPDNPLIYVNKGFIKMSGYPYEDIIGKNCRYLQGEDTNPADVKKIRESILKKEAVQVELLNYRQNNDPFLNYLSITPVFDDNGIVTNFIGVQDDVTIKKEMEIIKEKNTRQKLITEVTLQAQEKERKELGTELHDNINQLLASSKLYLNMAVNDEVQRIKMINEGQSIIDEAIQEIRALSKRLVGPKMEQMPLPDAISELINTVSHVAPFSIHFNNKNSDKQNLSASRKLMLYRIVQEQLNNTIKHARAKNLFINLNAEDHFIQLRIKDDGVGFDAEKTMSGIGLRNIKSRLELENGNVHINTAPGKGCEMIIALPTNYEA